MIYHDDISDHDISDQIYLNMIMATQVRVKREESKGDLETKLNVVDEEERRLDFFLHHNHDCHRNHDQYHNNGADQIVIMIMIIRIKNPPNLLKDTLHKIKLTPVQASRHDGSNCIS